MVVENAFGRLKGRWSCLLKRKDYLDIQYTTDVIATCVVFQNICKLNGDECNPKWINSDDFSQEDRAPPADVSRQCTGIANNVRETLKDYLYSHQ